MESMTTCRQAIETLRCRVREQTQALATLGEILSSEAEALRRNDQCRYLRDLKARVRQEVRDAEETETVRAYHFTRTKATSSFTSLVFGTLGATLAKSREHPLSAGIRRARAELRRTEPFGTVLVAVRPGDRTHEVEVIPLSCLARKHGRSEAETRAKLEANGYLLVEPETFCRAMDEVTESVLKGTLPVQSTESPSSDQQRQVLNPASVLARALEQKLQAKAGTIRTVRRRD